MSTRTRSMALDGHSVEAEQLADAETKAKVGVVVLDLLRRTGGLTDDALVALYDSRAEEYPGIPKVTPQRIRTVRAALSRIGLVVDSGRPGLSARGNAATVWQLDIPRSDAA